MTRVLLEGVSKVFAGNIAAVSDVTLKMPAGELTTLVGPSGCGKTTLLRLVAGLETPTAGDVRFDDKSVLHQPCHRRNVAMVFQDEALQPHLSVKQNLAFGLKLRRPWWWQRNSESAHQLTNGEITQRITKAAEVVGIGHLLNRLPQQLSGGERQRVALGQAMARQPSVLLLDEPLSQLDARLRGELRAEIKQLQRRLNVTTIYVTHDQDEAMALGDQVAVISSGVLHQVGPPLDIYDRPSNKTVAQSLGNPPMNFIDGQIQRTQTGEVCFVGGGLQVVFAALQSHPLSEHIGRRVELGVRPEHVELGSSSSGSPADVESLANITMVETLGDSTILRLQTKSDTSNQTITSKTLGRASLREGDPVAIGIAPQRTLIFDTEHGALLSPSLHEQPNTTDHRS